MLSPTAEEPDPASQAAWYPCGSQDGAHDVVPLRTTAGWSSTFVWRYPFEALSQDSQIGLAPHGAGGKLGGPAPTPANCRRVPTLGCVRPTRASQPSRCHETCSCVLCGSVGCQEAVKAPPEPPGPTRWRRKKARHDRASRPLRAFAKMVPAAGFEPAQARPSGAAEYRCVRSRRALKRSPGRLVRFRSVLCPHVGCQEAVSVTV